MKSDFTFEQNNREQLETFEWDNTWIEQTQNNIARRILYIGDSISCGIRRFATECSDGNYLFDGFGSSKALDNPYLAESISLFAKQQGRRSAVLLNNGLHGWHLNDETEYKNHYNDLVSFMKKEFPGVPIGLVLSTDFLNDENSVRVSVRNEVVREIASTHNCAVIDLYTVSKKIVKLHAEDGVHFTEDGYRELAKALLSSLDFLK